MIKKQAHYKITIYSNKSTVVIEDPITCHFNVSRGVLCDNNKATIELYNLAPSTREEIFQDTFTIDTEKFKYITLEAGYGNSLSLVFKGRILQAYSKKSGGQTDVITEIQAVALDIFDFNTSYTFKAGTSKKEAFQTMVLDMPNVKLANMGSLEGEFLTDTTFDGGVIENLNKLTGGAAFVDNGDVNCLLPNEVIDVPVPVISDDSCLLETPMRRDANLEVKMLFQPDLIVGQLLEIKSRVANIFNGQFKVIGFSHDCVISGAESGTRITTVNLWIGPLLPNATITLTGDKIQNNFNKVKAFKVTAVIGKTPETAKEVWEYIVKHKGNLPNSICYGNITWKNMLGNNNTSADRLAVCNLAICTNAYYTAKAVYKMVTNNFQGKKPVVTSGWRSPRNNASCGGAAKSRHLFGLACDFVVNGLSVGKAYPIIQQAWSGFSLNEGSWIHVQIEPNKGIANDK